MLSKLAKYEEGQVSKSLKKKIVNDALKDKFTPAQIHEILKPQPAICETGKRKGKPKFQRWAIFPILTTLISQNQILLKKAFETNMIISLFTHFKVGSKIGEIIFRTVAKNGNLKILLKLYHFVL